MRAVSEWAISVIDSYNVLNQCDAVMLSLLKQAIKGNGNKQIHCKARGRHLITDLGSEMTQREAIKRQSVGEYISMSHFYTAALPVPSQHKHVAAHREILSV